jgi:OOP family OmpA-OmpF porin
VTVGGGAIGNEDAGVLVSGSGNLGVTVSALVADGRGHSDTWSFMGNAYFDFNPSGAVNPYVGGGLGYATTKVVFDPSGVAIASDRDGGLAYQGIVGVDVGPSDRWRIFGEYRYFGTSDVETGLSLLPGTLNVENESNQFNGGIRFHF